MVIYASILLYILLATVARADNAVARAHHECVLLTSKIYCYGGAPRSSFENSPSDVLHQDIFISLDVSGNRTAIELQDMWETVDGGSVGPNFYFAMAALPELDGIFIDGGRGSRVGRGTGAGRHVVGDVTEHVTSVYNASGEGSWSSVNSSRERVEAHVALTGRNNTVYIYGGRSSDTYTGSTTGDMSFPERLTTFNYLGTPQWNQPSDPLQALTSQRRIHHKGAFGPDQQIIYYIGGIYESRSELMGGLTYTGAPMKEILSYDTSSGSWRNVTATGITPNYRMDHTVTFDPRASVFIIYGGTTMDSGSPLDDYLYTLDAMTWEYTRITPVISAEAPGAGPRYGHAAVLVNNSNLFIIFGSNGTAQNSLHVLDISNNFTWQPSNDSPVSLPGDGSSDKQPGNGPSIGAHTDLKDGVVAGIIVGSLAGVAIIVGAMIFFRRRKRRGAVAVAREMREDGDSFKPESPRIPNEPPPPYNMHQSDTRINLSASANVSPEGGDVNQPLIVR